MNYAQMNKALCAGWNTWNTHSVLSHVLLPYALAINLGFKNHADGSLLSSALISRFGEQEEHIHPMARSMDGSFTRLKLSYRGIEADIVTAVREGNQFILVTPVRTPLTPPALLIQIGMLWGRPGLLSRSGDTLMATLPDRMVRVFADGGTPEEEYNVPFTSPYLSMGLSSPVGICTGTAKTVDEIATIINAAEKDFHASFEKYGDRAELMEGMQAALAWDTIYEPENGMVCSPVSRIWNVRWGGYVLFDWDTYFAALMAAWAGNKQLAYANFFAITRLHTKQGFIPNFAAAHGSKSEDRSEPPVGALTAKALYEKFGDRWLLEESFDTLYRWNQWYFQNRRQADGTFSWGSDPITPWLGSKWETFGAHDRQGAAYESGLDNSPMYDDIPFDKGTHMLMLSDVGLTALMIADCLALVSIAELLGRRSEQEALQKRTEETMEALEGLWSEEAGIYLNRRTDNWEFSARISPTLLYALFSPKVTAERADRMIREHMMNPRELWGEYVLPTIARNDPSYPDQDYWRGRIWGPANFLVFLALQSAGKHPEAGELARKSAELFLKEWRLHGHVHENYSAEDGMGCGIASSDKFYHWGGLLALMSFME